MKQLLKYISIVASCFLWFNAKSQNAPDTTPGYPTSTVWGTHSHPIHFDAGTVSLPLNIANDPLYNYVRVYTPTQPTESILYFHKLATTPVPVHVTTTYTGGWGEPLMKIDRNLSGKDMVTPYDYRVRDSLSIFLPYADTTSSTFHKELYFKHRNYYLARFPDELAHAYSAQVKTTSGNVPSTYSYKPGKMMVGYQNGDTVISSVNLSGEVFKLNYSASTVCKSGTYSSNQLSCTKTLSPHGQSTLTYKDRAGRLICSKVYEGNEGNDGWLCTYYIYNELGQLVVTVPPKVAAEFESLTCITASGFCFITEYNEHGDAIKSYIPGKGYTGEYAVYSMAHQPVMTQTAMQRDSAEKWSFVVYDKLQRPVLSGVSRSTKSRDYWQGIMEGTETPDVGGTPTEYTLEYWLKHGCSGYDYPDSIKDAIIYSYNYYDNYSNATVDAYNFAYTNSFTSYFLPATNGNEMPKYMPNAYGRLTASRSRIISNGYENTFVSTFISSAFFYDEKGRLLQTQSTSPYTGIDTMVTQYHFTGAPVLTVAKLHTCSTCDMPVLKIQTSYNYDNNTRRLMSTSQKLNDEINWKPIATYTYNELGQVASKKIGGVDLQDYTYNIRGQVIGINLDSLNRLQPSNTRSYYSSLSYDDGFNERRYDGRLSGYRWRAAGSPDNIKAYGYQYDNAGRMKNAEYRDSSSAGSWIKTARDFTVSNLTYDANGNMRTMKQRGYNTSMQPADMDVLSYSYNSDDQLLKVTDAGVASPIHAFVNTNGSSNDYTYDADGNLRSDANKGISKMLYTHGGQLKMVETGGGSIKNIYSAGGALLQRTVIESGDTTVYKYIGPIVFKNDTLQYVMHGEGRARWLADSARFAYDFFVKDHLGNIRTTVTMKETVSGTPFHYDAGFEVLSAAAEEAMFDNIGIVRDNNPNGTPTNLKSARLNGSDPDKRIAASLLLHGMAGDRFKVNGSGYYEDTSSVNMNTYTVGSEMLSSLLAAVSGGEVPGSGGGDGGGDPAPPVSEIITNLLSTANYDLYDHLQDSITDPNYPRAYLSVLYFDEEFHLRPEHCDIIQLIGPPGEWTDVAAAEMEMPGNGYLWTFFTVRSDMDVHFDEITTLVHEGERGQEQHYYPHGLAIDAGSSPISLKTKHLYQGKRYYEELGLELHNFHARNYDAQLGRFCGVDPANQYANGYIGMGNDPANVIDPDGMRGKRVGGGVMPPRDQYADKYTIVADFMVPIPDAGGSGMGGAGAGGPGGGGTGIFGNLDTRVAYEIVQALRAANVQGLGGLSSIGFGSRKDMGGSSRYGIWADRPYSEYVRDPILTGGEMWSAGIQSRFYSLGVQGSSGNMGSSGSVQASSGDNGGSRNNGGGGGGGESPLPNIAGSIASFAAGAADFANDHHNGILEFKLTERGIKTMGYVKTGLGLAGNVLGAYSAIDHFNKATVAFSKGDNINGLINVGKIGLDAALMVGKASNPVVLIGGFAYSMWDMSGTMQWGD